MYNMEKAKFLICLCLCFLYVQAAEPLLPCGKAFYRSSQYTCYDTTFLCPVLNGTPTLRCGPDCYLPTKYSCSNGRLVYPPSGSAASTAAAASTVPASSAPSSTGGAVPTIPGNNPPTCPRSPTTQHLSDPPYENYFYSDCHVAAHVIVTSPRPDSNLTVIGPRLIVAWPAGNSGVCAFFAPQNGVNGSLGIELMNSTSGVTLTPVYKKSTNTSGIPSVGVSGIISFNSSAILTIPILGGVRTIRDFTEGPSLLQPNIQGANQFKTDGDAAVISRLWLDNITTTEFGFRPITSTGAKPVTINNKTLSFSAGEYIFYADFDYPQLTQLTASAVLNPMSQGLITQNSDQTTSLSFLSYTEKLLAGTWRFLTYFGRDSMIAALLLKPVLSQGPGGALEAVIGAVLERINSTDGSVAHEETIGDYATYLNEQMNMTSTAPSYNYVMIDTDYFLPVLMDQYFLQTANGSSRVKPFLSTQAGKINPVNSGKTWGQLAQIGAEKIMTIGGRFAAPGNQTIDNLAHLKADIPVGEWRDSNFGLGGGRIPYDVNTGLVPAALRSIAALSRAGVYSNHSDWGTLADTYAKVWEDETLKFFEVTIPAAEAKNRLQAYSSSAFPGPSQANQIDSDVFFHAISLQGNNNLSQVQVMNTDDCFRLFLVNSTNQTQLTSFVNQTANNVMRTFPAGLLTSVGMVVANPAYGKEPVYAANFTTNAYHGTVVWSWQQAMMARGIELQLARCSSSSKPDFCSDKVVYGNLVKAYNALWDVLDKNRNILSQEVWSWIYRNGDFQFTPLGSLPPPPGSGPTESDIRQLWSLTFLAVTRNMSFK